MWTHKKEMSTFLFSVNSNKLTFLNIYLKLLKKVYFFNIMYYNLFVFVNYFEKDMII